MIRFLLFLSERFLFVKKFLDVLCEKHIKKNVEVKDHKKLAEELAQIDLKRVVAYEKYGDASGYQKPNVLRIRR